LYWYSLQITSILSHAIFSWGNADETLEVFAKERGIRETEVIGNAGNGLVGVHEFHFDTGDEGTVNPFLSSNTASLADDSAKVALGEAKAVGIVANLVLLGTVLIDELDKTVENGLLA
jgi:hypothetical protein